MSTPEHSRSQRLGELADRMVERRPILAFTGAGISTGSGIPDFRGPQGIWTKWRPVYYDEFMSSHEARVRHWEYKLKGWRQFRDARPNPAHRALAELDRLLDFEAMVTQNIDGLHQEAGHDFEKVIELHGTNRKVECQSCLQTFDPESIYQRFEEQRESPLCSCGGFLKPATVSFGQMMPEDKLARAFGAAERSRLVFAVGSTLEVEPAASVPRWAQRSGAFYAILNRGSTGHDQLADLRLEGDAGELLPELLRLVRLRLGY